MDNATQVTLKVRRNALLLRVFTTSRLVRATGLSHNNVSAELQSLEEQGYLVQTASQGEALYRLSEDAEKRLELSRSLDVLYDRCEQEAEHADA